MRSAPSAVVAVASSDVCGNSRVLEPDLAFHKTWCSF